MTLAWSSDSLSFRDLGSYRFTDEQRKSYVLACDVEIVSYTHESYVSFKSNPPNGFWGYATIFQGSVPVELVALKWPVTRIFLKRNDLRFSLIRAMQNAQDIITQIDALAVALQVDVTPGQLASQPETLGFSETVVKVKGDGLEQFNINVYWIPMESLPDAPNYQTASDATDGKDEYPAPKKNPVDNPWSGNSNPSSPQSSSDPRDYGAGANNNQGTTNVRALFSAYTNPNISTDTVALDYLVGQYPGIVSADDFTFVCENQATTSQAGTFCNQWHLEYQGNNVFSRSASLATEVVVSAQYFPPS